MNKFSALIMSLFSADGGEQKHSGRSLGRFRTNDIAFTFRMSAGSPGEVNRTHPASIEPALVDGANPPLYHGNAVVYDRTGVNGTRQVTPADTFIDGFLVRPYPTQQSSATNYGAASFGLTLGPTSGIINILKSGYILCALGGTTAAVKGGTVYIWVAASTGTHIQGGVEAVANGANTIALPTSTCYFNGPADAQGTVEVAFNV